MRFIFFLLVFVSCMEQMPTAYAATLLEVGQKSPQYGERPKLTLSQEDQKYFDLGRSRGQESKASNTRLDEFEEELGDLYTELSNSLLPYKKQTQINFFDGVLIRYQFWKAKERLAKAEKNLLRYLGAETEDAKLRSLSYSQSSDWSVTYPKSFRLFLDGVYSRNSRYISLGSDHVKYGGESRELNFIFPSYCFGKSEKNLKAPLPAGVSEFLQRRYAGFDPTILYDVTIGTIRERIIRDTRLYSQRGYSKSCGSFGEVAPVGNEVQLHIFPDSIMKDPAASPFFQGLLLQRVRTHETMHYILKSTCIDPKSAVRFRSTKANIALTQLDEAQASIATLAILANLRPKDSSLALIMILETTQLEDYALVYEIFFRDLFRTLVVRKVASMKAAAEKNGGVFMGSIPKYFHRADTRNALNAKGDLLLRVELPVIGGLQHYEVNFDRMYFATEYRLLDDATSGDVIEAAVKALRGLSVSLNACKNRL